MARQQNQDPGWIIPLLQLAGGAALLATLIPGVQSRFPSFGIIALAVLVAALVVLAGYKVYQTLAGWRKKNGEEIGRGTQPGCSREDREGREDSADNRFEQKVTKRTKC
jgi:hypothetical protein